MAHKNDQKDHMTAIRGAALTALIVLAVAAATLASGVARPVQRLAASGIGADEFFHEACFHRVDACHQSDQGRRARATAVNVADLVDVGATFYQKVGDGNGIWRDPLTFVFYAV